MRWERAKNLMLLFFVLLNIFLGSLLYREQRRYVLSPEQEQAIRAMFTQHNIGWYIYFIRQYPPMRPLAVAGYDYDMDAILGMFFPDGSVLTDDPLWEKYINEEAELVISNGHISYTNPWGMEPIPSGLTRENAMALCDGFVAAHFPHFVQDYVLPFADGFYLFYHEQYREHIIYSNFIEFFVSENGITQVDMKYGAAAEYYGAPREICSPDEALLTFIQRVRSIWPDEPIIINRMDIVYYQEEIRPHDAVALHATPYYRIFIGEDNEVPFLINAYTNVYID